KVAQAEVRLLAFRPDLAIVDGLLPDARGTDWIATLRARGDGIPIVFVSAFWRDLASYEWLTRTLGVALVMYKPLSPEQLVRRVEMLLGRGEDDVVLPPLEPISPSPATDAAAGGTPSSLREGYRKELPAIVARLVQATLRVTRADDDRAAMKTLH